MSKSENVKNKSESVSNSESVNESVNESVSVGTEHAFHDGSIPVAGCPPAMAKMRQTA